MTLELLAPAKDLETAIAAINSGADAVYIGAEHHGARASASNSIEDIKRLCEYAHRFRVRIYVTLNTLVYDNELEDVRRLIWQLYEAGVDALIVQDMALLEMNLPPIPLHASTQCDIRTPEKALFLQNAGFSQLVLPREMTLEEISEVRKVTNVPLEGFVHGALCVCYSGDCRASFVSGGRSANRGECAQICRLPYSLIDGNGKKIVAGRHLLSLKDLNRLSKLKEMIDAGITSFKIEGRLKSKQYVSNVTAAYSDALNQIVQSSGGALRRSSFGSCSRDFHPDLLKTFNRGYTTYFLDGKKPQAGENGSMLTPKHVGTKVATILGGHSKTINVKSETPLANGDGMGFFDATGTFVGFRVNRFEQGRILLNEPLKDFPKPGTALYRNYDKAWDDRLTSSKSLRTIAVKALLQTTENGIALTLNDERACQITVFAEISPDVAKSPQKEQRLRVLTKTGDTIYRVTEIIDMIPEECFVAASVLTDLRRRAIAALDSAATATYAFERRNPLRDPDTNQPSASQLFGRSELDLHDNVANRLAEQFYRRHGLTIKEYAIEAQPLKNLDREVRVMTSRHCIRRELGLCLKTAQGRAVAEPLTLIPEDSAVRPMRLEFDCQNCQMHVSALPSQKYN